MSNILLNPGPTNTRFMTKLKQWLGSDVCHREKDFINTLTRLQNKLLRKASFQYFGRIAIMAGSGTTAMEAMISSLIPDNTLVIDAGSYGRRAIEIMNAYKIKYEVARSKNIDDLKGCKNVKHVYFVENETSSGENYCPERMSDLFPSAKFFIDATSAFGANDKYKLSNRVAAFSFCSNKCLQSTPGLGVVVWRSAMENFKRSYVGDLTKYNIGSLPFTLPVQSVYALDYTITKIDKNKRTFDMRRSVLIEKLEKIGIKCLNKYPCNSIIAFKHPNMKYKQLHNFLKQKDIVIYSGVAGVENSFRISTMSTKFDKSLNKIVRALNDSCIH
jgi:2-aminoethylphosphonate-pyruvate transaminase